MKEESKKKKVAKKDPNSIKKVVKSNLGTDINKSNDIGGHTMDSGKL